jgi:hypothetical protein
MSYQALRNFKYRWGVTDTTRQTPPWMKCRIEYRFSEQRHFDWPGHISCDAGVTRDSYEGPSRRRLLGLPEHLQCDCYGCFMTGLHVSPEFV